MSAKMQSPTFYINLDQDMDQLKHENQILETLLCDLHKYVTSHAEINNSPFELPSTIKPDQPVASLYRQSLDIYNKFKEMESEMESVAKQLFQLLSLIVGDGEQVVTTGCSKGTKDVAQSFLEQGDQQNVNFQSALFALEQMKQRDQKYDELIKETEVLQTTVDQITKTLFARKHKSWPLQDKMQKVLNKIQSLVSDLESVNTVKKQLQHDCEKLQNKKDKIKKKNKELKKSKQDMDRCLSQEKEKVSDLQKKIQAMEKEERKKIKKLTKTIEEHKKQIEELISDKESFKTNFQIQEDLNRVLDEKWKLKMELLQENVARLEMTEKQVATYQQREAQLNAAYDDEVLKSEIQKKQISDLQVQRDELLNRLSKLAGDRLTHENTNITDLSDADRPTKLAETYSELYDNEWTDAFEELTGCGLTDVAAVGKLLDMLLVSFHKCREITWERYRSLKSIVSTINIVHVVPCVREFPEKIKATSTESELSSHRPMEKYISIHLEERNKESEVKVVLETSEPMELRNERVQQGKRGTENEVNWNTSTLMMSIGHSSHDQREGAQKVNNPDDCTSNAMEESEPLYNRNKEVELTPLSKKEDLTCTTRVTLDQEKEIKSIWRTTTTALKNEAVKHLHRVLLTEFDISIKDWPNTSKYLASCIDLCWKMGVQTKPMHLDVFVEKDDGCEKTFDLEKFRAYTKTGTRVAFVVWPALFLHEGGAMLVKGIAQGCLETDK